MDNKEVEMSAVPLLEQKPPLRNSHESRSNLLSKSSVNLLDGSLGYILNQAAFNNDCAKIKEVLDVGISPSAADYDMRSALHISCAQGFMEATKLLVEAKAEINAKDRFNLSPLDEAIKSEKEELISYLIDNGAQLTDKTSESTFINICAGMPGSDTIKSPDELLFIAESMLKAKVNPNCKDYDSRTPLHLAVAEGNVKLTKMLLDFKGDPTLQDRWRGTALAEVSRHANRSGLNEMVELFDQLQGSEGHVEVMSAFSYGMILFEIAIIILFYTCTTYTTNAGGTDAGHQFSLDNDGLHMYPYYQDVHVMIFIGFGYLMTFLRKCAFQAVGMTFLISALCIQWYILNQGFFERVFCAARNHFREMDEPCHWDKHGVGLMSLVTADFCAASVMITYGGLLGKVTPLQLAFIAFFEVICFTINEQFLKVLAVADIGGTMTIHAFGAYFGFACSVVLRKKEASTNPDNASGYHSDLFAMIGTVFLFLFWPSFNGATGIGAQQERAVVNTLLSLTGSVFMAFVASHILRKEQRFNMVDIQNATLAGGVVMGACCDMMILPGSAILIGGIAGTVSTLGFIHIQPLVEKWFGFQDTCGINNLHGMPSIIGGFASTIAASCASLETYGAAQLALIFPLIANGQRTAAVQANFQLAYLAISVFFGLATGAFTGVLIRVFSSCMPALRFHELFNDKTLWEVPGTEMPYFFDHRGEVQRDPAADAAKVDPATTEKLVKMEKDLQTLTKKLETASAKPKEAAGGVDRMEQVFDRLLAKLNKSD